METTDIRKISVGKDFPDKAMHYQVGKPVNSYIISRISLNKEPRYKDKLAYDIFLVGEEGTVLWKTIVDMPVVVENNIYFD
jgi:hypothetical protein|tara:strand:+ start:68 stop:310 length:243 start_codon:yes stop_codon:yes gene_type:complete